MNHYWLGIASKEHVRLGVAGGFCQLSHGKAAPLKKMHRGDWLIYYSPKARLESAEKLQAFTAVGQLTDDNIYLHPMTESFIPYRRNAAYVASAADVPLHEVSGSPMWKEIASKLRFGHFEIPKDLFLLITGKMGVAPETFGQEAGDSSGARNIPR